ncbi:hypothetical protein ABH313_22035 [Chromobacterium vaccinii]|uniref:hypothetical protein n=1 Tax=Chromobacterium vaccinii TaxID=1108595 RepID=UPI0032602646
MIGSNQMESLTPQEEIAKLREQMSLLELIVQGNAASLRSEILNLANRVFELEKERDQPSG